MERVLFAPRELPPLGPDVTQAQERYATWVGHREQARVGAARRTNVAHLDLVMPMVGAPPDGTERTLKSLGRQTSVRWTLFMAVTEEWLPSVKSLVRASLSPLKRRHVRPVVVPGGTSPAGLLHAGVASGGDNPVALIFPGDVWAPDAVAALRTAVSPRAVVYADEDTLPASGLHRDPRFKPDFSPDFLLSSAYVGRPLVLGPEVTRLLPTLVAADLRTLEHEWILAACDTADSVVHLPEILCHRLPDETTSPELSADGAYVRAALRRTNDDAEVLPGRTPATFRIARPLPPSESVSILIPFRDQPRLLRTCVDSVTATTRSLDVELILIDNGSSDPEVLTLLEYFDRRPDVNIVSDPEPFNWARLNNTGARLARGNTLLFLNNDIEALQDDWLPALVAHALRPDVGAVGARLVYPNGHLQHCGIVVGLIGAAGHPLIGLPYGEAGYMNMALTTRECSAVTGACLATRRDVFVQLLGFDEKLGLDLNDVDYCLRAAARGLRTVYEPAAELVHHESPSRGTAGGVGDIVEFIARWRDYISAGDPYLNPNLTRADPTCSLASSEEDERWNRWYTNLTAR